MKPEIEILKKKSEKSFMKQRYFKLHPKEFVEKLVRNFMKLKKIFPIKSSENFKKLQRLKLEILGKF